ncbi:MAG: beta-carotene 15,15'-dioxygenase, Brp/Blh family [Bdellovibrio sp.]|nr:beta-carotene 15,15'-dioxygenase, Brp/Blh family [Bdellovibrio sp.]
MNIYDHVIFGAGLSGLLKAESLMDSVSTNERVLLIDSNSKNVCQRTFCAWRNKTDQHHPHENLVSHSYSQFRITAKSDQCGEIKSFDDFVYERISGDAFYRFMHQKIFADFRFEILEESVVQVRESKEYVEIETSSGQKIYARKVWNSLMQGKPDIIQHFFGFEIETEKDFFNENLVDLMDFRLEQDKEVRFVYHLPFSKRVGLVEFTIFSTTILSTQEYEMRLRRYLERVHNLVNFTVLNVEMGAIPMSLDPWPLFSSSMGFDRITPIGGAAGKIKASTGYSFMRNQSEHRKNQSEAKMNGHNFFQWRFQVYDTLLIGIMKSDGAVISEIFPKLFAQNRSAVLFRFLDEKTKFFEEIRIFIKLPWKHFLKQLGINYPFFFVAAFLIFFNFMLDLNEAFKLAVNQAHYLRWWLFPVVGLFTIGIAHGAIDHLLNPEISKFRFYTSYFAGLISFIALWLISPILSLAVFILISADHFGENQFLRAIKISNNQRAVRVLSFVWGLSVSLMAPLFNWESAKSILAILVRNPNFGNLFSTTQAAVLGFFFAAVAVVSAHVISKYEEKALGRSLPGAISSVVLCFTLWAMPLVPGFLTFFCFWHARDTIFQQRKQLNWSAKKYLLEAAPYTMVASFSLLGLLFYFDSFEQIWSYLFLLLGALTVSHSFVMKRFYKI